MRPVLLRVLTDLFVSRDSHPRDEIRQYEAIALGLIDKTDEATRAIIAGKLARFGATPPLLVEKLMDMGGEAAIEFLRHSSLVTRRRLLAAAIDGEAAMAIAVAGRPDLDHEITRALAGRSEIEVTRALVNNLVAPISDDVARRLVTRGRHDRALGQILCRRYSDPDLIAPLFLHASGAQRTQIISATRRADLLNPGRSPRNFTEQLHHAEIERAAVGGDRPLFSALLAQALGASLSEANEIIDDPRGEPLALALAALRVPVDAAIRIFMCLDPAISHSHDRVRALGELVVHVPPAVAERLIIAMIEKPEPRRRPAHASVSDPTAAAIPSRPANTAREVAQPRRRGLFLMRGRA